MSLDTRLSESAAVRAAAEAIGDAPAWVVGGAVREGLLDHAVTDLDLAVERGEREAARSIADRLGGHAFELSERFGTWRVAAGAGGFGIDVTRLRATPLDADLAHRDFTVNAMAVPLAAAARGSAGAEFIDPHGGREDLRRGVLRAVSEASFEEDPLRVLRAARFAAALGMTLGAETVASARAQSARAAEPSGERQLAELRALIAGPDPVRALAVLDELEATEMVLPELHALRGIGQSPYHHLDAHGHTLAVLGRLLEVERDLERYLGEQAGAVRRVLDEPLADEMPRGDALRLGALVHDLGKPATRAVNADGRVTFIGHDREGARLVAGICRRLRTSSRLRGYLQRICREHLRLGFLVHKRPVDRRAVFDYLDATEPDSVDVTLLTIADRLATQGSKTKPEAIEAHVELAREMIADALAWRASGPPRAPIAGDELARELGIEPGPELGDLLHELAAATFAGEVTDRETALTHARNLKRGQAP